MSNLDAAWAQATADIDQTPTSGEMPGIGMYIAQVVAARAGQAKKSGEFYFSLTFAIQDGRRWDEVKLITRNGVLDEGRAKSAAIMLRGLGIVGEMGSPTNLPLAIKQIVNRFFTVEITQSSQTSPTTGEFYRNTEIAGPANAPAAPVSDIPAAPAQPQAWTQPAQNTGMGFPPAVAPDSPPAQAPGTGFGDSIPWDNN